jgi:hypothetical protein
MFAPALSPSLLTHRFSLSNTPSSFLILTTHHHSSRHLGNIVLIASIALATSIYPPGTLQTHDIMTTRSISASQQGKSTSSALTETTRAATVCTSCFRCGDQSLTCVRHLVLATFHRTESNPWPRRFKFLSYQRDEDRPGQLDCNMGCYRTVATRQRPPMGEGQHGGILGGL